MGLIRKEIPDVCLLMAVTGPLLEKYSLDPPAGVFLLGAQPYGDVMALLQQADLFCLPSRSEGFACTVLEAAALGCSIVTTATGGSPDLLISDTYGLLLKDMEPTSISEACIRALSDPQWRANASVLTRQQLLENYTWDCAVGQLYKALGLRSSTSNRSRQKSCHSFHFGTIFIFTDPFCSHCYQKTVTLLR